MITDTASATYLRSLANAEEDHSSFCTLHDQVSVSSAAELLGCGEKEICLMQGICFTAEYSSHGEKVPTVLNLWPGCYLGYKGGIAA